MSYLNRSELNIYLYDGRHCSSVTGAAIFLLVSENSFCCNVDHLQSKSIIRHTKHLRVNVQVVSNDIMFKLCSIPNYGFDLVWTRRYKLTAMVFFHAISHLLFSQQTSLKTTQQTMQKTHKRHTTHKILKFYKNCFVFPQTYSRIYLTKRTSLRREFECFTVLLVKGNTNFIFIPVSCIHVYDSPILSEPSSRDKTKLIGQGRNDTQK